MTRAALLAVVALSVAMFALGQQTAVALGDQVEAGSCAIANSGNASGNTITCNFGLTPEQLKQVTEAAVKGAAEPLTRQIVDISKTLGVTQNAAKNLLKIVGEDTVPDNKLAEALTKVASDYKSLKAQVAALNPDNPTAKALVEQAKPEIEAGHFERAAALVEIARDQVQAVKLIDDGKPDQALTLLADVERRLSSISADATPRDHTQRGYDYKTYAEAFLEKGEKTTADKYLELAYSLFEQVRDDPATPRDDLAGAINGIGNVHTMRGQYPEAIEDYQRATNIIPNYAYAWNDMFLTYVEMAKQGNFEIAGMRHALEETKANAVGTPGLDADYLTRLEAVFNRYAQSPARLHQGPKVGH